MIRFTKFVSRQATTKAEVTATLEQIMHAVMTTSAPSKAELPWIKGATFGDQATERGSLRHDANVLTVTMIDADYDALDMSPQIAVALLDLAGIRSLVYTSPSYRPDNLKWRVLCPLSRPHDPAERKALVARLNGVLGGTLASESFVLSQSYYYGRVGNNPHHAAWIVDGAPLDTVAGLVEVYPPKVSFPVAPKVAGSSTDDGGEALRSACATFASPDAEGQRHHYIRAATSHVAPFVKAGVLDEVEAVENIRDACTESGRPPHPDEVESCLRGAVEYVQPWEPDPLLDMDFPDDDEPPAALDLSAEPPSAEGTTEDDVGEAFAVYYANKFRFDHTAGGTREGSGLWFRFDQAKGWQEDKSKLVPHTAKLFARELRKQRGKTKETERMATDHFRKAVARMASDNPLMAMVNTDWDADPWILGVPGGQVDLRTGEFSAARADVYIKLRTLVAPAPSGTVSALWTRFLMEATNGDLSYIAWLQRLAGYCLTGDVSEEIFAFFYGPGGAGKGTFLGSVERIMGKHAYHAPMKLFRAAMADSEAQLYQLAKLDKVRAVFASETEQGQFMAESLIKEATGNEGELNARHIYGAPFSFMPRFKVVIVGNYAPKLAGRSDSMERRMRVAPFNKPPAVPDRSLKLRLADEFPAILRWMLDGCLAWQREGLGMCAAVERASVAFFEEQDTITQWVSERCSVGSVHRGSATALLDDFNAWMRQRGEKPVDAKAFKETMRARLPEVEHGKSDGIACYRGIAVRAATAKAKGSEFDELLS